MSFQMYLLDRYGITTPATIGPNGEKGVMEHLGELQLNPDRIDIAKVSYGWNDLEAYMLNQYRWNDGVITDHRDRTVARVTGPNRVNPFSPPQELVMDYHRTCGRGTPSEIARKDHTNPGHTAVQTDTRGSLEDHL